MQRIVDFHVKDRIDKIARPRQKTTALICVAQASRAVHIQASSHKRNKEMPLFHTVGFWGMKNAGKMWQLIEPFKKVISLV